MKKDFLNKFLYFGFKFGKVFAAVALIVLVLVMLISGLVLLNFKKEKIATPKFEVVAESIRAREADDGYYSADTSVSKSVIRKEKAEKKFQKKIEEIIFENKLKPFAYNIILSNILLYDEKYQTQYVNGLKDFIREGLAFVKEEYNADLDNVNRAKKALISILEEYNTMFGNEIERVEEDASQQVQTKIVATSVLGTCILLFVLCLFLPLLIKIEENTRAMLEIKDKENE